MMFSSLLMMVFALPLLVSTYQDPMVAPIDDEFHTIHPGGDPFKCLDVRGGIFQNGAPVQIWDCNKNPGQRWIISYGVTPVRLYNTNFCLDAGTYPQSGVGMKIWQCYAGSKQQVWLLYRAPDYWINLKANELCLDLPGGAPLNGMQVQTCKCTHNNFNQVWTLG